MGERALVRVFERLRRDREGGHEARQAGGLAEPTGATRPWRFGDSGHIAVQRHRGVAGDRFAHPPALAERGRQADGARIQRGVDATLDVWGTGNARYIEEMKALAQQLGLAERVRFLGWAGPEERLSAYEDADVVVFPVRWEEPFGLVPLEAMGVGVDPVNKQLIPVEGLLASPQ